METSQRHNCGVIDRRIVFTVLRCLAHTWCELLRWQGSTRTPVSWYMNWNIYGMQMAFRPPHEVPCIHLSDDSVTCHPRVRHRIANRTCWHFCSSYLLIVLALNSIASTPAMHTRGTCHIGTLSRTWMHTSYRVSLWAIDAIVTSGPRKRQHVSASGSTSATPRLFVSTPIHVLSGSPSSTCKCTSNIWKKVQFSAARSRCSLLANKSV